MQKAQKLTIISAISKPVLDGDLFNVIVTNVVPHSQQDKNLRSFKNFVSFVLTEYIYSN